MFNNYLNKMFGTSNHYLILDMIKDKYKNIVIYDEDRKKLAELFREVDECTLDKLKSFRLDMNKTYRLSVDGRCIKLEIVGENNSKYNDVKWNLEDGN